MPLFCYDNFFRQISFFYEFMDEEDISRRDFGKRFFITALSVSILETLFTGCSSEKNLAIAETNNVIQPKATQILNHWSVELNVFCNDLKTDKISQTAWQEQIEKLFGRIDLNDLLKFIDFEKLTEKFEYPDLGVNTKTVKFPKIKDLPGETVFLKKIFGMKKGRAIIPHGHSNMASAHLVLQGDFSLRHYEKIEKEKEYLIIKPTIERSIKIGDFSSISDEKDNVHWFIADSETAFTYDVIMLDLKGEKYDIHNLDIAASEKLSGGILKAKIINVEEGLKKYGKEHHQNASKTL